MSMAIERAARTQFEIWWMDEGRDAEDVGNPAFPKGVVLDTARKGEPACIVIVPYPAVRCGAYFITCRRYGLTAIATTSGRADDPRAVRVPCHLSGAD